MHSYLRHSHRARIDRWLTVRSLTLALLAGGTASPAAAQMLVGDGSLACGSAYTVVTGDTLSLIAEKAYGDPQLYGFIADANWDALAGNPENVAVGMALDVPCVDASGQVLSAEQAAEQAASVEAAVAAEGPLAPAQLDALFGPVALFPDEVLTPVLVAATFPLDVVKAGRFVEGAEDLSAQERAAQAADEEWDASVRELAAAFPDLVTRMSDHIDWTEQAGEAVVAQTDDVLAAIQRLRETAQKNGYLVDNEAQTVEEVNDKIVISPADPNVVYVPTYDSQVVYTAPVAGPPVYHYGYDYDDDWDGWGDAIVAGGIVLGGAVILDEIFDDDDWDGWDIDDDIDWDGGDITIDRGDVDIDIDRDDIDVDRDRVDIDRDNLDLGDRDRPGLGDGDRVSIGQSDRTQIDRNNIEGLADRAGARDGAGAGNRRPISSDASRDAARQKIESRQATRAQPASLGVTREVGQRQAGQRQGGQSQVGQSQVGQRQGGNSAYEVSRPRQSARPQQVSRPSANRAPAAKAPSRSNTFNRPSNHRASAAGHRGRGSMGGRGGRGGGRGGGGRR
jgi:Protein of unknown function (DUF3300)